VEQLKVINPWLEDHQVEEVVKQLTASFPGTNPENGEGSILVR
jgi:type I restriction enzyme R subunit